MSISMSPATDRPGSPSAMHDHHGFGVAVLTLGAAALGLLARSLGIEDHSLFGTLPQTPDELVAWTKATCNSLFIAVNTLVGCYHLLKLGRPMAGWVAFAVRPRPRRRTPRREVPRGPPTAD